MWIQQWFIKFRAVTNVNAPARLLLAIDEVLHPVDVVEAEGHGGDEALQWDLDGQTKVLLQQGAGKSSHCFRLLEIYPGGDGNIVLNMKTEGGLECFWLDVSVISGQRKGLKIARQMERHTISKSRYSTVHNTANQSQEKKKMHRDCQVTIEAA